MTSPGKVSIRLASDEDIEAIMLLDRSLDTLPHWPAAEYRASIAGGDSHRSRALFVAGADREIDRQIVGLAVARADHIAGESSVELESVGVALSARRRGVGRELCRAVMEWCQSQGAAHLDLEVRSQSAGAVALYRELGFVAVGTRRSYYRDPADDAILMRLDLKREHSEPA